MTCGVYAIVNTVNGNRYVGSSVRIQQRWREHRRGMRKGSHHSTILADAVRKYGFESFLFVILEECDPSCLLDREQAHMDQKSEYNMGSNAWSPMAGRVHSAETRSHLSRVRRGVPKSEDHRRKIGLAHKGRLVSEETRRKIGEASRNRSAESRAKMSASLKGKRLSAKTREKMRQSHLRRHASRGTPSRVPTLPFDRDLQEVGQVGTVLLIEEI